MVSTQQSQLHAVSRAYARGTDIPVRIAKVPAAQRTKLAESSSSVASVPLGFVQTVGVINWVSINTTKRW